MESTRAGRNALRVNCPCGGFLFRQLTPSDGVFLLRCRQCRRYVYVIVRAGVLEAADRTDTDRPEDIPARILDYSRRMIEGV